MKTHYDTAMAFSYENVFFCGADLPGPGADFPGRGADLPGLGFRRWTSLCFHESGSWVEIVFMNGPALLISSLLTMTLPLPSRAFSSATLKCGLQMVEERVGMDQLVDKSNEDLQRELEELEVRFLPKLFLHVLSNKSACNGCMHMRMDVSNRHSRRRRRFRRLLPLFLHRCVHLLV